VSSFFSNLFRPSNAGTWFFFLLNLIFLATVFGTGRSVEGFLFLLVLYLLSLALSFSSLGQWMLCLVNGARRMARIDMRNKALPLVEEIYRAAKRQTPTLPNRINVRIMYDPTPNAFAIGTNTICLTEGLLDMPDDLIAGVIAHEMGHLALQHTIVQILIGGGNLIISIIMLILEAIRASLSVGTAAGSIRGGGIFHWFGIMMMAFCSGMIFLWTKFCMLLLCGSSRANEYEADAYAYQIGYGDQLAEALDRLTMGTPQASLLRILNSSHPLPGDRIGRLQAMGVSYSRF